jgi:hypothetical protein
MCSLCGWCVICLTSFISILVYFNILCAKLVNIKSISKAKHYMIKDFKVLEDLL